MGGFSQHLGIWKDWLTYAKSAPDPVADRLDREALMSGLSTYMVAAMAKKYEDSMIRWLGESVLNPTARSGLAADPTSHNRSSDA